MVLLNLFEGKEWRHRCRKWTCGHSGGGREWDEWRKEFQHIYIYILLSIRWIAGEKLLYSTRSPVWPSVMAWRDEMRRGEGG